MSFVQSKRMDKIISFLKFLFPNIQLESYSTGLRLITSSEDLDSTPHSLLKVHTDHCTYEINTKITFEEDDSYELATATLSTIDEEDKHEDFNLTRPLFSTIMESEGYRYESDFAEIITKLFHDLRYGRDKEEKAPEELYAYLLSLVSAHQSNQIERYFLIAEKQDEEKNTYLLDEELGFEEFREYCQKELRWLIDSSKSHLGSMYPNEWVIDLKSLIKGDCEEHFISLDKFIDKTTVERLKEIVDEESFKKIERLSNSKPYPVARFSIAFTKDMVIISSPNRIIVNGEVEVDMDNLVSSYMVAREGLLPKSYAQFSIDNCVSDLFSWIAQIIIRDADIDSLDDLGNMFF